MVIGKYGMYGWMRWGENQCKIIVDLIPQLEDGTTLTPGILVHKTYIGEGMPEAIHKIDTKIDEFRAILLKQGKVDIHGHSVVGFQVRPFEFGEKTKC